MDNLDNTHALIHTVEVSTSARLHMGFFDLSGGDSKFDGLGLAIDAPCTQITIAKNEKTLIDAKSSKNVLNIVENLVKASNLKQHFSLTINQVIPMHAGLGSGTQLALSIGAGLNQLFDLQLSVSQIAATAFGRRSLAVAAVSARRRMFRWLHWRRTARSSHYPASCATEYCCQWCPAVVSRRSDSL